LAKVPILNIEVDKFEKKNIVFQDMEAANETRTKQSRSEQLKRRFETVVIKGSETKR
jgi:hypothetical protein